VLGLMFEGHEAARITVITVTLYKICM